MNKLQYIIKYFTVALFAAVKYLLLIFILKISVEICRGSLTINCACGVIIVSGILLEICITIAKSLYIKHKEDQYGLRR